jgi:hypothetical protein
LPEEGQGQHSKACTSGRPTALSFAYRFA